jgi:hypothetical protein
MRLLSRMLSADWHCELKNGAVGVRLDEPQFAPVVFDHSKADSEPQSHSAEFCRKERIEYAFSILDRNSGTGVLDRQQYGRVTIEARREPQMSSFRGYGAHCVDSVFDKVQEYLLKLHAI